MCLHKSSSAVERNQMHNSSIIHFGPLKGNYAFLLTDVNFPITTSQKVWGFLSPASRSFCVDRSDS